MNNIDCVIKRDIYPQKKKCIHVLKISVGYQFLAPLAIGQQAYVMVRCASVRPSTFSLNIFSETTYRILMKFHRNVPTMVLFRIS